jgi:hypothetical protein
MNKMVYRDNATLSVWLVFTGFDCLCMFQVWSTRELAMAANAVLFICRFVLPLAIIVFCYSSIVLAIRRQTTRVGDAAAVASSSHPAQDPAIAAAPTAAASVDCEKKNDKRKTFLRQCWKQRFGCGVANYIDMSLFQQ